MTPEARPEVATPGDHHPGLEPKRRSTLSIQPPVPVGEGEFVPALLTLDVGERVHVRVPLGAFAVANGKPCFVFDFDVVGLVAASLGIGCGTIAVLRAPKIIRAFGDAAARRRGI
jgi:hypothetical protein